MITIEFHDGTVVTLASATDAKLQFYQDHYSVKRISVQEAEPRPSKKLLLNLRITHINISKEQ